MRKRRERANERETDLESKQDKTKKSSKLTRWPSLPTATKKAPSKPLRPATRTDLLATLDEGATRMTKMGLPRLASDAAVTASLEPAPRRRRPPWGAPDFEAAPAPLSSAEILPCPGRSPGAASQRYSSPATAYGMP